MKTRAVVLEAFALSALAGSVLPRAPVPAGFIAPPAYPSPHGGWTGEWTDSYAKAWELVSQMTLAEKANITAGVGFFMGPCVGNTGSADRLGFRQLCLQDGPLGVRSTDNVTAFPAGITAGATWDKDLIRARGEALGREFKGKGANIHLGPSVGPLGRKPRGGRNWEGFGSDPVLQAIAGAETIKGIQSQGVIATIKHLVANEQEIYRMYNPFQRAYSANVDDRAMHELYLWPFAEGIRAGVGSVMAAYNDVNGSQTGQNSYLINHLLKEEMGFEGFIMCDWLAQQSGVAAALAGLDMAMPGDTQIPIILGTAYWQYEMTRAVLNGSVPVDRLDDAATRIVAAWYKMGQDKDYPRPNFSSNTADREGPLYPAAGFSPTGVVNQYVNVQADHYKIARQVAQDAVTLLKNDNEALPLSTGQRISVFGTSAATNPDGPNSCTDKSCNKGVLGMGWGSGSANYPYIDAPIEAFKRVASNVVYYNTDSFPKTVPEPVEDEVAVVFITSDSGENSYTVEGNNGDRTNDGLKAWHNGDRLVQDVAAKYANVVVVVHTVGPIIVEPWIDLPSVKALVFAHLPGQEAGTSLTNVLFGDVSPSGHLPYSIPRSEDDYPDSVKLVGGAIELGQVQDTYSEGLYIDYRALNKAGKTARYAFGHGLSYASFSFSNATITAPTALSSLPPAPPLRGAVQPYSTTIPPAAEAIGPPAGFKPIWRYLYSWLSESDANAAARAANTSTYPYPEGYSTVQPTTSHPAGGGQGGNPALWDVAFAVTLTVSNTSPRNVSGKAVAQAYVQFPSDNGGFDTPAIQLRDFAKTKELGAGESETVVLRLTRKDVSVWDVVSQNWRVPNPSGGYRVWIGPASDQLVVVCRSEDLRCEERVVDPGQ